MCRLERVNMREEPVSDLGTVTGLMYVGFWRRGRLGPSRGKCTKYAMGPKGIPGCRQSLGKHSRIRAASFFYLSRNCIHLRVSSPQRVGSLKSGCSEVSPPSPILSRLRMSMRALLASIASWYEVYNDEMSESERRKCGASLLWRCSWCWWLLLLLFFFSFKRTALHGKCVQLMFLLG